MSATGFGWSSCIPMRPVVLSISRVPARDGSEALDVRVGRPHEKARFLGFRLRRRHMVMLKRIAAPLVLGLTLALAGPVLAADATVDQVYQAASSGHLAEAQ